MKGQVGTKFKFRNPNYKNSQFWGLIFTISRIQNGRPYFKTLDGMEYCSSSWKQDWEFISYESPKNESEWLDRIRDNFKEGI